MVHRIDQTLAILQEVMDAHTATLARKPPTPPVVVSNNHDPRAALVMRVLTQIEKRFGLDISRTTAEKLLRELEPLALADLRSYVDLLEPASNEHPEWISLIDRLVIGETYIMRDPDQLELFCSILMDMITQAAHAGTFKLRLWSIGCATGEEAFTLAALVLRVLSATGNAVASADGIAPAAPWSVAVLASDLSRRAIRQAQQATYETGPLSSFRAELRDLDRFFPVLSPPHANRLRQIRIVHPCVRSLVEFQQFNLLSDPIPKPEFDVVLCRNVMVHFSARARRIAQARLAGALRTGGVLLLGPTDTLIDDQQFQAVWSPGALVHRRIRRD